MTPPFAVVTGASRGIGLELARQFVTNGFHVLVTAEDEEIDRAAAGLGPSATAFRADLTTYEGVESLAAAIGDRPVDAAALNAGRTAGGAFLGGTRLDQDLSIIALNVTGTVHLAKRLLPPMVRRGRGRVLFTSSIVATMPGPDQSIYNASKSFVQSFATALREELDGTGVTITTLLPGPTDTEIFERAGMGDTRVGSGPKDDPAAVAEQGFQALMNGDARVVASSLRSKAAAAALSVLPDSIQAKVHRYQAEPGGAD